MRCLLPIKKPIFIPQTSNEPLERLTGALEWAVVMLKNPSRSSQPVPVFNQLAAEAVKAVETEVRNRNSRNKRTTEAEKESRRKISRFLVSASAHLDRVSEAHRKVSETARILEEKHPVKWTVKYIFKVIMIPRKCCSD